MTTETTDMTSSPRAQAAISLIGDINQVFEKIPSLKLMVVTFSSFPSFMDEQRVIPEFDVLVNDVELADGYSADPVETQCDAELMLVTSAAFHSYLHTLSGTDPNGNCDLRLTFHRSLLPVTSDQQSALIAFEYLFPEMANDFLQDTAPPEAMEAPPPARARPMVA